MEQQTELRGRFPWTTEEDGRLRDYVIKNGARHWDAMARRLRNIYTLIRFFSFFFLLTKSCWMKRRYREEWKQLQAQMA
ncbi:hypothetical protein ACS0TY_023296 [Phlomoides rotata]